MRIRPANIIRFGPLPLVVLACVLAYSAEPETAVESPSNAQIAGWVDDLESEAYARRERATSRLAEAGVLAIDALARAADGRSLEAASRATRLLMRLTLSEDEAVSLASLERIATLENRPVERAAAELQLAGIREKRATDEIVRLGGEFPQRSFVTSNNVNEHLHLGEAFQGDDKTFEAVKQLKSLRMLTVHGVAISDAGIKNLHAMEGLRIVQLFGTNVTPEGVAALTTALPRAKIEIRRGAFLGVQGGQPVSNGTGAIITQVVPESAANRAGILAGDRIVKYNDVEIRDFKDLTEQIAQCRPGDKARLELRRGEQAIHKEVIFGKWR